MHVADRDECWKFSSDLTLFDDPIRVPNINEPGCICLIPFDTTLKYVLTYDRLHCKYLNARSECNDIVISIYSHYPLDPNAKSSDTKCVPLSIR